MFFLYITHFAFVVFSIKQAKKKLEQEKAEKERIKREAEEKEAAAAAEIAAAEKANDKVCTDYTRIQFFHPASVSYLYLYSTLTIETQGTAKEAA
jgi:RNA-splicing ligase RtcB